MSLCSVFFCHTSPHSSLGGGHLWKIKKKKVDRYISYLTHFVTSLDPTGLQELGLAPAFSVAEEREAHRDSGKEIEADRHTCV